MESLDQFVDKLEEQQKKQLKNKRYHGEGSPGNRLPNKKKSTNK